MKFMILIYGSPAAWEGLSPGAVHDLAAAHNRVKSELSANRELVAASELDLDDARVVRVGVNGATVTQGAFTEGRQFLSGYYLIECADFARATQVASSFAEAKFAPIEVRQLGAGSSWEERAAT